MKLSPENQFIIDVLNIYINNCEEDKKRAVNLLRKMHSQHKISEKVKKVLALLSYKLQQEEQQNLSQAVRALLNQARINAVISNRIKVDCVRNVANELKKENIPLILLKGMAVNNHIYPESMPRFCTDVDILVKTEHKKIALECLMSNRNIAISERKSKYDNQYEFTLTHDNRNLPNIDLHFQDSEILSLVSCLPVHEMILFVPRAFGLIF